MTVPEALFPGGEWALSAVVVAAAPVAFFVRRFVVRLSHPGDLALGLVDVRTLCGLVGLVFGWAGIRTVDGLADTASVALVFFAGWVGFVEGCGLDLRVLRRYGGASLLPGLAEAVIACALVAAAVYAAAELPATAGLLANPASVLTLAAVCIAGPSLARDRPRRSRSAHRQGFWRPSLSALAAIMLATLAAGLSGHAIPVALNSTITSGLPWVPQFVSIEGAGLIFWGAVLGGLTGLVCDLATREDLAPGGILFVLAILLLLASGLAFALGLQPLWVGALAGVWLINGTLRRLDILHVINRGRRIAHFGLPLAAGWLLGSSIPRHGIDLETAIVTFAISGLMRPAVKIGAVIVANRALRNGPIARAESPHADIAVSEQLPLLFAVLLYNALDAAAGTAVLAGVMSGEIVLRLAFGRHEGDTDGSEVKSRPAVNGGMASEQAEHSAPDAASPTSSAAATPE